MSEKPNAPSLWHRSLSHYRTPGGQIVRIWNGHMLYLSRASEQQKAQAEIVKERETR